jgi:hypothetical protein
VVTILVGGVGKDEVARVISALGRPDVEVTLTNDMDAAVALGDGEADYFLGTCHTGAGASLGVLVALLGPELCHTFGRTSPTVEQISAELANGRIAFGYSLDHLAEVTPRFVAAFLAASGD